MNKNLTKLIRGYIFFGAFYALVDSFLYFSNLKLLDISSSWPKQAIAFSSWVSILLGSTSLFFAILLLYLQSNLESSKQIVKIIAFFATFHASLFIFASLKFKFDDVFKGFPSLSLWLPSYNNFLILQAVLIYGFALLVYLWQKSK